MMGYVTIAILTITLLSLLSSTLFGLLRGRNRSLLKLVWIVVSILLAFFLKDIFTNLILNIKIDDVILRDAIINSLNSSGATISESISTIAMTLVEAIIGIVIFLLSFFVFSFVSSIIFIPICKIFIKREFPRHRIEGVAIGFVQGLLVAFIICVPLTGMLTQIDKISQIQYQGQQLFVIPEEFGVHEYVTSVPAKLYHGTGHWFFEVVSTKEDPNGNKVSVTDACDIAVTVINTADTFETLSNELKDIDFATATPQEKVDSIKKLGDTLIELNNSIDELSDDAKIIVQEVLDDAKTMFANEDGTIPENVEKVFDNINVKDLKLDSAGEALNCMASYIEKTSDEFDNDEPVTQEEVDNIVNGLADNTFIIDMLVQEDNQTQLISIHEDDKTKFEQAITNTELSNEYKDVLSQMLGLN